VLTEREPDYVVVGETRAYSQQAITILVLSGITSREEAQRFPFLPSRIVDSVADLVAGVPDRLPTGEEPAQGGSSQKGLA
jgi:hypothetical protein